MFASSNVRRGCKSGKMVASRKGTIAWDCGEFSKEVNVVIVDFAMMDDIVFESIYQTGIENAVVIRSDVVKRKSEEGRIGGYVLDCEEVSPLKSFDAILL